MAKNIIYKENIYDISNYSFNLSKDEKKRMEKYEAKQKMIDNIRKDYNTGITHKELQEKYDCEYKTIKRYLNIDSVRVLTVKETELDSYSSDIYDCIQKNKNFHQIYIMIKAKGYTSSYENFFKQLKIRLVTKTLGNTFQLSRYKFSKLLYNNNIKRLKLNEENEKALIEYLQEENIHSMLLKMIEEFRNIFKEQNSNLLDEWINKYTENEQLRGYLSFQTFIKGIINDKKAVINQIENKITNGLTEGFVGKLKVKKRSTYGRSSFELLRCLIIS